MKTVKIRKIFTLFFFVSIALLSEQGLCLEPPTSHFSLILDTPMAYVLDGGRLEGTFLYERIDSNLDVFNFRKSGEGGGSLSNKSLGSVGDYKSPGGIINFGLTDRITLSFKAEFPKIDFGEGDLKITKLTPSVRCNIITEKILFPAVSLGFTYKNDRGEDIKRRFSAPIGTTDSKPPTIKIGGVKDETYSGSLYLSKLLSENFVVHTFFEVGKTRVKSEFNTNLDIKGIQKILKDLEYDQKNYAIGAGFHYRIKPYLIFNFNYKFIKVDRDIDDDIRDGFKKNNTVDVKINYILNKYMALTFQGKYFSNFLVGEVPFLYNRFTSGLFDNHYGYLGTGITFSYDYSNWLH